MIAQHSLIPKSYDQLDDREVLHIVEWIHRYSRRIELGDRTIPFRRLRKLISRYDCNYDNPKANQVYISRTILKKSMLRRNTKQILSTRAPRSNEGRDISKVAIAKIGKELLLDEPNGIDSATFYNNAPAAASEFIIRHARTLRRLARL